MELNPILACDGYKAGHILQYPVGLTKAYDNMTPRSNKHFKTPVFDGAGSPVLWVGMQSLVLEWLRENYGKNFFGQPRHKVVRQYKNFCDAYLGKDFVPVDHVAALWDLQYLPIEVKTVPEGLLVDIKTPAMTIQNTHKDFAWLVGHLETLISDELWPVATAATTAFNYRLLVEQWAEKTCDNKYHLPWQCHDFSARGLEGMMAASLVGLGHLSCFSGTDTIPAILRINEYYGDEYANIAGSVTATEHSVMCMGTKEGEPETYRRLIQDVRPDGIISIVSDTWNYWNVLNNILRDLKDIIMSREGKVVIRPDSGKPEHIIAGYRIEAFPSREIMLNSSRHNTTEVVYLTDEKVYLRIDESSIVGHDEYTEISQSEALGSIEILWKIFGGEVNSKGYITLDPHIGLIYGDSITLDRAQDILKRLEEKGFASSNVVLGVGSYTYQMVTRDTFGFAIKATWGEVDGEYREIFKDPITDDGTKKSHKGLIQHFIDDNGIVTFKDQVSPEEEAQTDLVTVFKNGMADRVSWADVRNNVEQQVQLILSGKSPYSARLSKLF